jgi:hypothetical protein
LTKDNKEQSLIVCLLVCLFFKPTKTKASARNVLSQLFCPSLCVHEKRFIVAAYIGAPLLELLFSSRSGWRSWCGILGQVPEMQANSLDRFVNESGHLPGTQRTAPVQGKQWSDAVDKLVETARQVWPPLPHVAFGLPMFEATRVVFFVTQRAGDRSRTLYHECFVMHVTAAVPFFDPNSPVPVCPDGLFEEKFVMGTVSAMQIVGYCLEQRVLNLVPRNGAKKKGKQAEDRTRDE